MSFVRQKAPSAKRCIKTHSCPSGRTSTGLVRKHRAPKGALRLGAYAMTGVDLPDQKAPSAKRCIKTATKRGPFARCPGAVRKHRAPNGALRQVLPQRSVVDVVPSQKAPSAKRCIKTPLSLICRLEERFRQKVPSAKRCIKTCDSLIMAIARDSVRKHQAPKGALRLGRVMSAPEGLKVSQKAPSAKRCIKTKGFHDEIPLGVESESTERQKVH